MFQLTEEETKSLRSQIVISNRGRGERRHRPYAFTEHGSVMLATILNSPTAIEASIKVVRAFIKMRSILALHRDLADRLEKLEKSADKHDRNFAVISQLLKEIFSDPKFLKRRIGFIEEKRKAKVKIKSRNSDDRLFGRGLCGMRNQRFMIAAKMLGSRGF